MPSDLRFFGILALLGMAFACQGNIGESAGGGAVMTGAMPAGSGGGSGSTPVSCQGSLEPGRAPLRRLTRTEYIQGDIGVLKA